MEKLIRGALKFRNNIDKLHLEKMKSLELGQNPETLFITCCDSRIVPSNFTSSEPGDLFTLRNIGNIVPPYEEKTNLRFDHSVSSTIEYAMGNLSVENIVICGHSNCGAMAGVLKSKISKLGGSVGEWLKYADSSYEKLQKDLIKDDSLTPQDKLSRINVVEQMENLKTYPDIQKRIEEGSLNIYGWWFDIKTASVYVYHEETKEFIHIDTE